MIGKKIFPKSSTLVSKEGRNAIPDTITIYLIKLNLIKSHRRFYILSYFKKVFSLLFGLDPRFILAEFVTKLLVL